MPNQTAPSAGGINSGRRAGEGVARHDHDDHQRAGLDDGHQGRDGCRLDNSADRDDPEPENHCYHHQPIGQGDELMQVTDEAVGDGGAGHHAGEGDQQPDGDRQAAPAEALLDIDRLAGAFGKARGQLG